MVKDRYNVTALANEFTEIIALKKLDIMELIATDHLLGKKLLFIFLDRLYFKLNKTNALYKSKIIGDESIFNS